MATPQNHKGIWTLVCRVPKRYQALDRRVLVKISSGIRVADDPRAIRARPEVLRLAAELERYWEDLAAGKKPEEIRRYEGARRRAEAMGLEYMTAGQLGAGSIQDIIRRLALLESGREADNPRTVEAVSGGVKPPGLRISDLVNQFEIEQKAYLARMSEGQRHRWRLGKDRAVSNLINVLGDISLREVTRAEALKFRSWWQDRIVDEKLDIETANKDIGNLRRMWAYLNDARQLGLDDPFGRLRIEGARKKSRKAFTAEFVQKRILADGALGELNPEARRVVYVCAETGMRPVEVVNLLPNAIRLNHHVPHLIVQPDGRLLKTDHSERIVPLVGVALAAMRLQPHGFPSYVDRAPSLCALVNKTMKAHGLRPEPGQSLYSLRHTFEDRLTAIEPPEKIQAYLMGHRYSRPKYGSPPSLEQLHSWVSKIAFRPPAEV